MDNIQKTFLMIKPDGIRRSLVGSILSKLEQIGLKLVYARMILASEDQARGNYPGTDEWLKKMGQKTKSGYKGDEKLIKKELGTTEELEIGQKIYDQLVKYLTSGPMIAMVWEGNHAVEVARKIVGKTNPLEADIGSIRGDFGFDTPQLAVRSGRIVFETVVHVSDSAEEAKREIKFWLGDKYKPVDYTRTDYIGYL